MPTIDSFPIARNFTNWARQTPTQGDCRCPAHDDSQASLSVGIGSVGNLLLHCHAGCSVEAILAAVGKSFIDLVDPSQRLTRGMPGARQSPITPTVGGGKSGEWDAAGIAPRPERPTIATPASVAPLPAMAVASTSGAATPPPTKPLRPKRRIVAQYDYLDAVGRHVLQVTRWEPKSFTQRHRDSSGQWINKAPHESRRVLYHLDQIANSTPETIVFLCEGEKDVDNLIAFGARNKLRMIATTAPGGAATGGASKKWLPQFTNALAGRQVAILPDSDPAGQSHAQTVRHALDGVAAAVAIVALPLPPEIDPAHKWDVSDWIQAGGTLDQLKTATIAAFAALEAPEAPEAPPTQPESLVDGEDIAPSSASPVPPASPGPPTAAPGSPPNDPTPQPIGNVDDTPAGLVPLHVDEIARRIFATCGNWPRRVNQVLFVHDQSHPEKPVYWLEKNSQLWAFIGARSIQPPRFERLPGTHTKEESFYRLQQIATPYNQVELLPHHPPLANHYYAAPDLPPASPDFSYLSTLIGFFRPDHEHDASLLRLAFATPFWGGPPGSRPMFVVTSDDGRGAGKSSLAMLVSRLLGAHLDINPQEDIGRIKGRLLSPEGMLRRIAVLDNVKSTKFSWGDLEGLITASTISGHRLHVGEGSRPNVITWFMTMNGVDLSTDMAKRCVLIKILRPIWSGNWIEEVSTFIDQNRRQIIADIMGYLASPKTRLDRSTRWGIWERDVLGLEPDPTSILQTITSRQEGSDVETEEVVEVEDAIRMKLEGLRYESEYQNIFIPSRRMVEWYSIAIGERGKSVTAVVRAIRQRIREGYFAHIVEDKSRRHGRGFVWYAKTPASSDILYDLEDRIRVEHSGPASFGAFGGGL